MIREEVYYNLKERFGKVSSWTLWQDAEPQYPKSNIGDMSVFHEQNLLEKLQTNYVFVGLNPAVHDYEEIREQEEDWCAFHSTDNQRQNDYKLRYALKGTEYWGSYITDIIKGYNETNSQRVLEDLEANKDLLDRSIELLRTELEIIGEPPVIIALGGEAYRILIGIKEFLPPVKSIVQITHFSYRINKENYKKRILRELQSVSIINGLLQKQNPDHLPYVLRLETHWKQSVAWRSNDYDEFITVADRITGEVTVQCIDKTGQERVSIKIECDRSWIEGFFASVERTYWRNMEDVNYALDASSWNAKIRFLKDDGRIENKSFFGAAKCPFGARRIEQNMVQMLKQHGIQISVSMFSGDEAY